MNKYVPKEYWEERLKTRFDITGVGNIGFNKRYNEYLYRLQKNVLRGALRRQRIALQGKYVLDVGCGTGIFTKFYLDNSAQVTGIDITRTSVESLQKAFPQGRFITTDITSDISHPELAEGSFDVVNVFGVLYHIVDDDKFERALENLSGLLKPGGCIFISDFFGRSTVSPSKHVAFRSAEKYGVLKKAGVRILEVKPIYHFMNRSLKSTSLATTNFMAPLLYLLDSVMNRVGFFSGRDIKLLTGIKEKQTGAIKARPV